MGKTISKVHSEILGLNCGDLSWWSRIVKTKPFCWWFLSNPNWTSSTTLGMKCVRQTQSFSFFEKQMGKKKPQTLRNSLFNNQQIHPLSNSLFIFWDCFQHVKCRFIQLCETVKPSALLKKHIQLYTPSWSLSMLAIIHKWHFSWKTPSTKSSRIPNHPTTSVQPRCHVGPQSVAVDLEIHLHLLEATNHPIALCQSQSYSLLLSFQITQRAPTPKKTKKWMLWLWSCYMPAKIGRKEVLIRVPRCWSSKTGSILQ